MKHEKRGVFYLLAPSIQYGSEFILTKKIVCNLTKIHWRSGKSVLIACDNESQAKEIDEDLWNFDLNSFLPHSLFAQHLCRDVPIVVYWNQCNGDNISRDVLINLAQEQNNFFINFKNIVDFVSSENVLKKLARIRYKSYKNFGFQLRVVDEYSDLVNN